MKTRNGWVSNSSSSSFILCGICLPFCPQNEDNYEELKEFFTEKFYDQLVKDSFDCYSTAEEFGLEYQSSDDGGDYLGITPDFSKDDRTIGSIKQEVDDKLKEVIKDYSEYQSDFITGSTYD